MFGTLRPLHMLVVNEAKKKVPQEQLEAHLRARSGGKWKTRCSNLLIYIARVLSVVSSSFPTKLQSLCSGRSFAFHESPRQHLCAVPEVQSLLDMAPPSKRRKTSPKVEEISFDTAARQDFLTGFHKRKVQRTKQAQAAAERKAREGRIAERKRIREERKADLERHVKEVNALIRPDKENEDEDSELDTASEEAEGVWDGIEDSNLPPIDHEAEYVDEDKYTTVTVEVMDATRDGLSKLAQDSDDFADEHGVQHTRTSSEKIKKPSRIKSAAEKQRDLKSKANKRRKKNFRYESKTERKVSRMKEKLKSSKQAKMRKAG